jgi:hypothetical protein
MHEFLLIFHLLDQYKGLVGQLDMCKSDISPTYTKALWAMMNQTNKIIDQTYQYLGLWDVSYKDLLHIESLVVLHESYFWNMKPTILHLLRIRCNDTFLC